MVGILVHGDNHFIVRGPKPNRLVALELVQNWTFIQIEGRLPPHLGQWQITTREFRENLEWGIVVPAGEECSDAVAQLLRELQSRGVVLSYSDRDDW